MDDKKGLREESDTLVDPVEEKIKLNRQTLLGFGGEELLNAMLINEETESSDQYIGELQEEIKAEVHLVLVKKLNDPNFVAELFLKNIKDSRDFYSSQRTIEDLVSIYSEDKNREVNSDDLLSFDNIDVEFFQLLKTNPFFIADILLKLAESGKRPMLGFRVQILEILRRVDHSKYLEEKIVDINSFFNGIDIRKKFFSLLDNKVLLDESFNHKYGEKIRQVTMDGFEGLIIYELETDSPVKFNVGIAFIDGDTESIGMHTNSLFNNLPASDPFVQTLKPAIFRIIDGKFSNLNLVQKGEFLSSNQRAGWAAQSRRSLEVDVTAEENTTESTESGSSILEKAKRGILGMFSNKK